MHGRSTTRLALYVVGAAMPALLLACSSGNNNKNTTTATTTAISTVATTVATPTVIRTAGTPTPAAGGIRTATPTTGLTPAGGVRTATPSTGRTPTPATGSQASAAASVAAGAGPRDAALQTKIEGAALKASDLPAGYMATGDPDRDLTSAGEVAAISQTYTSLGQGGISVIVDAISAFKDTQSAQDGLKAIQDAVKQTGGDVTLTPIANPNKYGDETLTFKVGGTASGIPLGGFAIVWRRGKTAAAIFQAGAPGPAAVDALTPLVKAQDSKLSAAGL